MRTLPILAFFALLALLAVGCPPPGRGTHTPDGSTSDAGAGGRPSSH